MTGLPPTADGTEVRPAGALRSAAGLLPRYPVVVPGPAATGGPVSPLPDPVTGSVLAEVAEALPADVERGLDAAARARDEAWAWAGSADRARHLLALVDALATEVRPLAATDALTRGRPAALALAEAEQLPDRAFSAAGWADKLDWAPLGGAAVGLVAVLAGWRTSPAALVVTAVAALACGNAVLLRPRPPAAPLAHRLAEAAERAGLPAGLVTVLPGSAAEADAALLRGVGAVRAGGRAEELRALRVAMAERGAVLSADPDALTAEVVLPAADLGEVLPALTAALREGAAGRPGGTLVLAPQAVLDELAPALQEAADGLRLGDPLDRATDVGPCPSPELAADAVAALGARVPRTVPLGGWWCPPGVLRQAGRRPALPPPGPVVALRSAPSTAAAAADLARYGAAGAVEVRVWGAPAAEVAHLADVPGVRSVRTGPGGDDAWAPVAVLAQMAAFRG
ncbi:acyl-CoA reductase-like NAD-dependent aldehyde dehydrogenase [Kineococcus xinjiangensis]|uniref:Acyl-CoA reductase-like NAD-dependent aldehyde dehydrogenase n=1 Tax=Kineococcus xinjiangensis TaxID=512762 RepID=A0A2S6ITV9_9ACTN|nr:aldehyde dehydrogenase family protein [Kineococcus xinjiangensis]PPK97683.1 acyl-CoA reductase-like NAD-dependent aldehyde dehydrogenase [Kineococcus xinjiangensis]